MKNGNRKPVIILRKNCIFYEVKGRSYPVLSLILLANQRGFLWLSDFFARRAKKASHRRFYKNNDDDDAEHLDPLLAPIDGKLSDEMEIRVGVLTKKNKHQVFKKYDFISSKPYKGDLKSQYEAQMRVVLPQWKSLLKWDRDFLKDRTRRIQPTQVKRPQADRRR
jgi:hypothetical protein